MPDDLNAPVTVEELADASRLINARMAADYRSTGMGSEIITAKHALALSRRRERALREHLQNLAFICASTKNGASVDYLKQCAELIAATGGE